MNIKLDPILLIFQFIGIMFVATNRPIEGTIIFLASLSTQILVAVKTQVKTDEQEKLKQEVDSLKEQFKSVIISTGLRM